jgi:hypothetical protein
MDQNDKSRRALPAPGLNLLKGLIDRALREAIWDAVVGRELAARAQPTVLASGVLHVLVQDHRWRDQLDAMRAELKSRLNARLGREAVRELRFGLAHAGALPSRGPGRAAIQPPPGAAMGPGLAPIEAPAPELPAHLRCAASLGPELREAFLRAGQAARRERDEASA